MYHIPKLLCNISPKTGDFFGKREIFCLTYAGGAIIFKIANFEIIIFPPVCHVWLAARVSPVSGSCFAFGWPVFHPVLPGQVSRRDFILIIGLSYIFW